MYTEELELEEHDDEDIGLQQALFADGLSVAETEFGPVPDPCYDSPQHIELCYIDSDGEVHCPWLSPSDVCFDTLEWMAAESGAECPLYDFDEHDVEYIRRHGAYNEHLGYETSNQFRFGVQCQQCKHPEARLMNTSLSKTDEKLEMLCEECIERKFDRSRRRAPRRRKTQDIHGLHGHWAVINERREAMRTCPRPGQSQDTKNSFKYPEHLHFTPVMYVFRGGEDELSYMAQAETNIFDKPRVIDEDAGPSAPLYCSIIDGWDLLIANHTDNKQVAVKKSVLPAFRIITLA